MNQTSLYLDPRLQEELNRFKEIQKNPQLLLHTLFEMEQQKHRQIEGMTEMAKILPKDTNKHETIVVEKCNENSLVCYICGNLLRRTSMKAHLDAHNGCTFTCTIDQCNAVFKSKQGLTRHQLVHRPFWRERILSASQVENGKKSHICKACGKSFPLKSTFLVHFRIHTGEKPERCRLCYKSFRQKCALRLHSKSCLHTATFPIGSK